MTCVSIHACYAFVKHWTDKTILEWSTVPPHMKQGPGAAQQAWKENKFALISIPEVQIIKISFCIQTE